jgi:hypothetical protein
MDNMANEHQGKSDRKDDGCSNTGNIIEIEMGSVTFLTGKVTGQMYLVWLSEAFGIDG